MVQTGCRSTAGAGLKVNRETATAGKAKFDSSLRRRVPINDEARFRSVPRRRLTRVDSGPGHSLQGAVHAGGRFLAARKEKEPMFTIRKLLLAGVVLVGLPLVAQAGGFIGVNIGIPIGGCYRPYYYH